MPPLPAMPFWLALLLLVPACQEQPVPETALARVGDATLTETDLEGWLPIDAAGRGFSVEEF